MSLIIWSYIFGGATLFGVIVGIFSVWNGRRTRADLREVLQSIGQKMDEGFRRMDEGFRRMDEWFRKMDERAEQRHQEFREFMKQCEQRHRELMEIAEQRHREVMETLKQQHQDVVELLKRGFGGSAGGAAATA